MKKKIEWTKIQNEDTGIKERIDDKKVNGKRKKIEKN